MPKFMYTVIISTLLLWVAVVHIILRLAPNSPLTIVMFLLILFLALLLTLSIPFYFYLQKKAPIMSNLKKLYRKALKWSVYFSGGITIVLALQAFKVLNLLNLALFLMMFAILGYMLKKGQKASY